MPVLIAAPTFSGGLDDEIYESLVRAETFTLVELEDGRVKSIHVVENLYKREPYGAGSKVALFLVNLGASVLISRVDCPKGRMIFDSAGVRLVIVDKPIRVRDALRRLDQ